MEHRFVETGRGADIRRRVFDFACAVTDVHRRVYTALPYLRDTSRQAMRAATSVGANLEEADAAQSRADFISKCNIALKEAREARYWLRLLDACGTNLDCAGLIGEGTEIIAILTTIVKRSRSGRIGGCE